ncbi:flagellar protein FliT [Halomonas sp. LR5S13]|uniref:flagellar protein FliT n=1 Tax=Halomonas rhizosphaerae TaxID=3043296 RepID=UPI0024A8D21E|nr:flagellar protein FliT [Halomonas rhizosphaerae]MDI5922828.1 flagellar protein FliT [Halomonas rhizosphaerae]
MDHGGEPSSQQALVEEYEALLSRTRLMLDSARDADWPALVDQESTYIMQVKQVAKLDAERHLDANQRARKAEILEQILENDLEIRERLIERRDELGKLISASQRQRNLRHAYGVGKGGPTPPTDLHHIKGAP